ncbi:hypothetical protein CYLTODRAFT_333954, partial [Cylindrobasidium torrendii FP15055 ss-10]
SFEQLFSTASPELSIPDTSIEFPPSTSTDEWLSRLQEPTSDRKLAFFDERMSCFLTLRLPHPQSLPQPDLANPPSTILKFLAHLQLSLEAMFIPSLPGPQMQDAPRSSVLLSAPPKQHALGAHARKHHPSIFPPATPNPTPFTTQNDKQYLNVEGTILWSGLWGQDAAEAFALLWSDEAQSWIAAFKLTLGVAYTRLTFGNPLLCVTVAATLRESAFSLTQAKSPLREYLVSFPELASLDPKTPASAEKSMSDEQVQPFDGFEEVNLLEGLAAGPSFHPSHIYLPSSRLGPETRRDLFSLPPLHPATPSSPTPSPMTVARTAHPTLRKAFRKTLHIASGIQMRMRTTFVPAVILPGGASNEREQRDLRKSGNAERTVVLCVELENPDQSNSSDFFVEDVEVLVADEGARTHLIGWGDSPTGKGMFPMSIGPQGQFNLLYAVTFLQNPQENDGLLTMGGQKPDPIDLRRSVDINVIGKPVLRTGHTDPAFPTESFTSKWNTILNLSPRKPPPIIDETASEREVLPEPASPFPVTAITPASPLRSPRRSSVPVASAGSLAPAPVYAPQAGRRHTMPVPNSLGVTPKTPIPPIPNMPRTSSGLRASFSPTPPSAQFQPFRSGTTYDAPPPTPGAMGMPPPAPISMMSPPDKNVLPELPPMTPTTPAYPAYPPATPGGPFAGGMPQSQYFPESVPSKPYVGPAVEMQRDRPGGQPLLGMRTPPPLGQSLYDDDLPRVEEPILVSIGLLEEQEDEEYEVKVHGTFTLDVFVYNQSERTRRLEISYPDRRSKKRREIHEEGLLPLDNRVRIGPLQSTACQSVRMRFMALRPGVHSIDLLVLTDVESGASTSLRCVV